MTCPKPFTHAVTVKAGSFEFLSADSVLFLLIDCPRLWLAVPEKDDTDAELVVVRFLKKGNCADVSTTTEPTLTALSLLLFSQRSSALKA